jgi:hypothetical protein
MLGSHIFKKLTLWRKNRKVHHHIHNSSPPFHILNQLNPIQTLPANVAKIHSDDILPSMPWSSNWSLSFWLSHQNLVNLTVNKNVYRIFHVIFNYNMLAAL